MQQENFSLTLSKIVEKQVSLRKIQVPLAIVRTCFCKRPLGTEGELVRARIKKACSEEYCPKSGGD